MDQEFDEKVREVSEKVKEEIPAPEISEKPPKEKKGGIGFTRRLHEETKKHRKMAKKSRRINRGK